MLRFHHSLHTAERSPLIKPWNILFRSSSPPLSAFPLHNRSWLCAVVSGLPQYSCLLIIARCHRVTGCRGSLLFIPMWQCNARAENQMGEWKAKRRDAIWKCAKWAISRLFIFNKEKQLTSSEEANTSHYRPLTDLKKDKLHWGGCREAINVNLSYRMEIYVAVCGLTTMSLWTVSSLHIQRILNSMQYSVHRYYFCTVVLGLWLTVWSHIIIQRSWQ